MSLAGKSGPDMICVFQNCRMSQRAINTLWTVLEVNDLMWIPVIRSWRLNERHYGGLQVSRGSHQSNPSRGPVASCSCFFRSMFLPCDGFHSS